MNYVYEGRYALLVKLKVPYNLAPGTPMPIRARFDYLVCTKEVCVPESAELVLNLSVGAPGAPPVRRAEFDFGRKRLRQGLAEAS